MLWLHIVICLTGEGHYYFSPWHTARGRNMRCGVAASKLPSDSIISDSADLQSYHGIRELRKKKKTVTV